MSISKFAPTPSRVRGTRATAYFAAAAMLVSYLPFSAVNGTLGLIGRQVAATTSDLAWVTGSFTIALVIGVLVGGLRAGRFGLRRATVSGLALTIAGSVVGLLGASLPALWTAEAIVGVGAGVVMSASLQLIGATSLSAGSRTRAIAVWAAANVAGLGLGPFLAVIGNAVGGWASFYFPVALLAAGAAVFGATRAIEPAGSTPFPPESQLRSISGRQFSAAGMAAFAVLFAIIGVVFVESIGFHKSGIDPLGIAVRLACLFAGNVIASIASGPLQVKFSSPRIMISGLIIVLAGLLAVAGASTDLPDLAWRLALLGAGTGAVVASSAALAVRSAPGPLMGIAGTGNTVIRQLGAAAGPLIISAISPALAFPILLILVAAATLVTVALLISANRKVSP